MIVSDKLIIAPFGPDHEKSAFRSGNAALDRYIARQAGQDMRRRTSRVFVANSPTAPDEIVGYYTLSALSIELGSLPAKLAKKLPKHPVPAALLGRLAVAESKKGLGVGRLMLADAVKRCMAAQKEIAIYAMAVDPIDDEANEFYRYFGFVPLDTDTGRLFLPLQTIGG